MYVCAAPAWGCPTVVKSSVFWSGLVQILLTFEVVGAARGVITQLLELYEAAQAAVFLLITSHMLRADP